MKKYLLLIVAFGLGLFLSCTADKEPDYAKDSSGIYNGNVKPANSVMHETLTPQKVELTYKSYNVITLTLFNFSFSADGVNTLNLGNIIFNNIPIEKSAGSPIYITPVTIVLSQEASNSIKITVSGVVDNGKMNLNIQIVEGEANKTELIFEGNKQGSHINTEALIKSITFKGFDFSYTTIEKTDTTILTFFATDTLNNTQFNFEPIITLSEGATIYPLSGVVQDFSKGTINYTVTAQDSIHKRVYSISFNKIRKYDFENWVDSVYTSNNLSVQCSEAKGWSSTNKGLIYIRSLLPTFEGIPVTPTTNAKSGEKAARIETFATSSPFLPYITVGKLFLGNYKWNNNPLLSTHLGIHFTNEPLTFSGWYAYTPGNDYYMVSKSDPSQAVKSTTMVDSCSIVAVLYEITNDDDFLTADNLNTSDKVVLRAELNNGSKKDNWTHFNANFVAVNGKTYNASKRYKMAIICSSSYSSNAQQLGGAPGSVLMVDDFVITSK